MVRKPANLTFEQAAAVPVAGFTALRALRDHGRLKAAQHVLVNGASGGVGTFAAQIAKALGAEVTGVCSSHNVAMAASIGANHVIDYTQEDFTRAEPRIVARPSANGNGPRGVVRSRNHLTGHTGPIGTSFPVSWGSGWDIPTPPVAHRRGWPGAPKRS